MVATSAWEVGECSGPHEMYAEGDAEFAPGGIDGVMLPVKDGDDGATLWVPKTRPDP